MITVSERYLRLLEQRIRLFGFEDRFIKHRPVRYFEEWIWPYMLDAFEGKPEELIERFEKEALGMIKDGADTVIVPGYPLGAALAMAGYREVANTGAMVVDGNAAALKMAEILSELHRSIGLAPTRALSSHYQQVPGEFVARASQAL
jgi:hypothetical protein